MKYLIGVILATILFLSSISSVSAYSVRSYSNGLGGQNTYGDGWSQRSYSNGLGGSNSYGDLGTSRSYSNGLGGRTSYWNW